MKPGLIQAARRLNRWAGLLGLVIGIAALGAGIAIGVWSVRTSEEVTRRSGGFDKPKLVVALGSWTLIPNRPETLIVGAAFEAKSVTLLQIPLRIANQGSRTAHDVTMLLRLPEGIRVGVADFLTRKISRFDPGLQVNEAREKVGHFEFQSYNLSRINPGSSTEFAEAIVFGKETSLQVIVPERNIRVNVSYGFTVDITVQQENGQPQSYSLLISSVKASDERQLEQAVEQDIGRNRDEIRRRASFREYLAELIGGQTEHLYIALITPEKKISVADGSVVTAAFLGNRIGRVSYARAFWRRLLVR
jgi:hypothetical protein